MVIQEIWTEMKNQAAYSSRNRAHNDQKSRW